MITSPRRRLPTADAGEAPVAVAGKGPGFGECGVMLEPGEAPIPKLAGRVQAVGEGRVQTLQESVHAPIPGVEYMVLAPEYTEVYEGGPPRALVFCGCWLSLLLYFAGTGCTRTAHARRACPTPPYL